MKFWIVVESKGKNREKLKNAIVLLIFSFGAFFGFLCGYLGKLK